MARLDKERKFREGEGAPSVGTARQRKPWAQQRAGFWAQCVVVKAACQTQYFGVLGAHHGEGVRQLLEQQVGELGAPQQPRGKHHRPDEFGQGGGGMVEHHVKNGRQNLHGVRLPCVRFWGVHRGHGSDGPGGSLVALWWCWVSRLVSVSMHVEWHQAAGRTEAGPRQVGMVGTG